MKDYIIEAYKRSFPPGTQVEMISMDDSNAVPRGTRGAVIFVDAVGTIHVNWENGSTLGICPDVDQFRRVSMPVPEKTHGQKPRARGDAR